jgi:hypothetical protein
MPAVLQLRLKSSTTCPKPTHDGRLRSPQAIRSIPYISLRVPLAQYRLGDGDWPSWLRNAPLFLGLSTGPFQKPTRGTDKKSEPDALPMKSAASSQPHICA